MRLLASSLAICAVLAAPVRAEEVDVDAAMLERDLRVLADDSMEGREAGTKGYAMASGYVAGRFAALGVSPGGDNGTYFQGVPMLKISEAAPAQLTVMKHGETLFAPQAFVDFYGGGTTRQESGEIEAELVFIGYGMDLPDHDRDDFAGVDLKGKIAVRAYGAPSYLNTEELAHYRSTVGQRLSERGAIGSILLWSPVINNILSWDDAVGSARGDSSMTWKGKDGTPYTTAPSLLASTVLSPEMSRKLLEGQDFDYDDLVAAEQTEGGEMPSFDMGLTAKISWASIFENITTDNVIGIVPGTDPAVADQYVVITGHLDHEGIKPTEEEGDDETYNGAMDNATGIATMLEVARLLKQSPTRRPVMFVALTAEEKGLVGSSYNANNPTVPAEQVALNLNLDMPIVTYHFTDLNAFGAERSNVYPYVEAAVEESGMTLSPDPDPKQGLFVRSDQYSYIKKGVPAIYLKTGFADGGQEFQRVFRTEHYHQASDKADLIDFAELARFAGVNYRIARNVGNMAERPAWKAGDFFGTMFKGPMLPAE